MSRSLNVYVRFRSWQLLTGGNLLTGMFLMLTNAIQMSKSESIRFKTGVCGTGLKVFSGLKTRLQKNKSPVDVFNEKHLQGLFFCIAYRIIPL